MESTDKGRSGGLEMVEEINDNERSIRNGFEASRLSLIDDDDEEDHNPEVYVDDDALTVPALDGEVEIAYAASWSCYRERTALDVLVSRSKLLGQICGYRNNEDNHEATSISLSEHEWGGLFLRLQHSHFGYIDRAFSIDLVGSLRRHILTIRMRQDGSTESWSSVRIDGYFFSETAHLREWLIDCISHLCNMEALDVDYLSFKEIGRILKSAHQLKELRLLHVLHGLDKEDERGWMEQNLSTNRNIATLRLDINHFLGAKEKDEADICEAFQSLVRPAVANTNLKKIIVSRLDSGRSQKTRLDDLLQPHLQNLFARTKLNRNSVRSFRQGGASGGESSTSWTQHDCVEFLAKLHIFGDDEDEVGRWVEVYGEEFQSLVALDALYLAVRMRPDLCITSQVESRLSGEGELFETLDGMVSLSI